MLDKIVIHVSKSATGDDYVQIMSPSAMPVNIVLVASAIEVVDARPKAEKAKKVKKR